MSESAWLERVGSLVAEVLRSDASEFELVEGSLRVRVRRRGVTASEQSGIQPVAVSEPTATLGAVLAPLTGIFYLAPSPGAPAFVEAGDWIAAGAVIGLIEAMKVFNEVTSDRAGVVVQVLVEEGSLVRTGQELLRLDHEAPRPAGLGEADE